jgi:hypothetical protein
MAGLNFAFASAWHSPFDQGSPAVKVTIFHNIAREARRLRAAR